MIAGLLGSPMASLGAAALASLEADAATLRDDPRFTASPGQRALAQLKTVDATVQGVIRREIAMTEELRKSARRLGVINISVLPDIVNMSGDHKPRADSLLAARRFSAMIEFGNVWEQSVSEARALIEAEL